MGLGQALLKLDFVNAFNAICVMSFLRTVHDELPELFQFISTCYDSASHLCFGEFLISSGEGAQQGDPLLAVRSTDILCVLIEVSQIIKIRTEYLVRWTLGGDVDVLLDDLETVRKVGSYLVLR